MAAGNAIRDVVGYWITGMIANTLLSRISTNMLNSSGR
jgi:hypothetical protein